ncbi:hypothetical protein N665_0373s0031 [Sinapis alba]|nr:hypothetical protein N665_0373s0031 [Sinapis alba]
MLDGDTILALDLHTLEYRYVPQGNFYFCDNEKRLFKYYPETNTLSCISSDICVISDFAKNLVSLRPSSGPETSGYRSGFHYQHHVPESQRANKFRWIKLRIPSILLLTTTVVSIVTFSCFAVRS